MAYYHTVTARIARERVGINVREDAAEERWAAEQNIATIHERCPDPMRPATCPACGASVEVRVGQNQVFFHARRDHKYAACLYVGKVKPESGPIEMRGFAL